MGYKNMKHKDLAKIIGVSQQAASRKLKGEADFKRSEMQKIKAFFQNDFPGITMDQIFTTEIFLPQ